MEIIAPALGRDLKLRASEAAIFGVVAVRNDFYAFDGIFRRRDDGAASPNSAGGADAVNRNAVILGLVAVGDNLDAVLSREDAGRAARSACASLSAGKVKTTPAAALRFIPERSGS